jgi:hypothetical protein
VWALKRRRGRCLIPRIVSHRLPHQGVPSPLSRAFTPPLPVVGGAPFTPSCPKRLAALGVGLGPITHAAAAPSPPDSGAAKKKKPLPFLCAGVLAWHRTCCVLCGASWVVQCCVLYRIAYCERRGPAGGSRRSIRSSNCYILFLSFSFFFWQHWGGIGGEVRRRGVGVVNGSERRAREECEVTGLPPSSSRFPREHDLIHGCEHPVTLARRRGERPK